MLTWPRRSRWNENFLVEMSYLGEILQEGFAHFSHVQGDWVNSFHPYKGTSFVTRWTIRSLFLKLDTAQLSFPKNARHFRNAWLWGLSRKLFLAHPKIISSLPEGLWSQSINLSYFISVSTEFSPAPREEVTGFCCKLLCSSHALHMPMPKCFCKERKASSPPGWLLKESRKVDSS